MIWSQIPRFRLPLEVIDEEVGYILGLDVEFRGGVKIESMKKMLAEGYDAIFVGSGAPRGRDLDIPGRMEAAANIHIGIDWLSSVSFGHVDKIGRRVIVLGGGNTAMDCCRTSRRLGGTDVKVIVRSGYEEMKASPWEKEDATHEDIPILNFLVPKAFTHDNGKLTGITFEKVKAVYDERGRRDLVPTGEPDQHFECDDVLGRRRPGEFLPVDRARHRHRVRQVGHAGRGQGDDAVPRCPTCSSVATPRSGPKNIIWAVAHGHDACDLHRQGVPRRGRARAPVPSVVLSSQKMGIHEWSYDNDISIAQRYKVPWRDKKVTLKDIKVEVELGFDPKTGFAEAQRCLNCDVQTVFATKLCIECDACVDICPMDCITFTPNAEETELRAQLNAPATNLTQDLYVSEALRTGRVMAKDEDVCLHCGLCAERCPTGAWDMQKFLLDMTHAGPACRSPKRKAA
jgi:NADPH-dependent glutamate synthase beta subunit-like oxidoreductase